MHDIASNTIIFDLKIWNFLIEAFWQKHSYECNHVICFHLFCKSAHYIFSLEIIAPRKSYFMNQIIFN